MKIDDFKRKISDMGYYVEIDGDIVTVSHNIMDNAFITTKLSILVIELAEYSIIADTVRTINHASKLYLDNLSKNGLGGL